MLNEILSSLFMYLDIKKKKNLSRLLSQEWPVGFKNFFLTSQRTELCESKKTKFHLNLRDR